jgi:hypothetical protein
MKKVITSIAIAILLVVSVKAQKMELNSMSIHGGLAFSTFIFKDPLLAIRNQYDYKTGSLFGVNFVYANERHLLRPEVLLRKVGSVSNINNVDLSWTLTYLDFNLAYMYKLLDGEKFQISPGLSYGIGYMLQGQQYNGQTRFEANADNFLRRYDLTTAAIVNMNYKISQKISLFGEYRFGISILNLEKDDNQKTRNMYHSLSVGLSSDLTD